MWNGVNVKDFGGDDRIVSLTRKIRASGLQHKRDVWDIQERALHEGDP